MTRPPGQEPPDEFRSQTAEMLPYISIWCYFSCNLLSQKHGSPLPMFLMSYALETMALALSPELEICRQANAPRQRYENLNIPVAAVRRQRYKSREFGWSEAA